MIVERTRIAATSETGGYAPEPAGSIGTGALGAQSAATVGAATLLSVESKVRAAANETELAYLIANELRKLVAGRQAIVLRAAEPKRHKVTCISSVVLTDKDTPFVRWIEGMVLRIVAEHGGSSPIVFELPGFVDKDAPETRAYPFRHVVWQPMRLGSGDVFASVLVARETPWLEQDLRIIARETGVFSTIWQALYGVRQLTPRAFLSRKKRLAIAAAIVAACCCPVPMTTLAPVEIVAQQPQRVTAPIDGVIREILVDPNQPVVAGQTLLRFDDTSLRNRLQVGEQETLLAEARLDRTNQASFADEKARHELAQARAEFELKSAERDYAAELLARSTIVADRDGVLIYADRDRWIGRPVRIGERIMQIVNPKEIAARVELPVADAIVLDRDAQVRLFLDANPLRSVRGRLISEGYQAEPNSTQQLVYRLQVAIDGSGDGLRIGARGTAQLQGAYVPLAFYLLRRPISAARQYIGL